LVKQVTPPVIVQVKVYEFPPIPVNVELYKAGFEKLPPLPLVIVHKPVPGKGLFPASVTVVNPQVGDPI
jgi:hypothetical protein